jgi:hypothetical protein
MRVSARPFFKWLGLGALAFIAFAFIYNPDPLPRWPVQRKEQRRIVRERVAAIGGWEVLHREATAAFGKWEPYSDIGTNIPPAITQLKPREVRVYADTNVPVIARLKFFGAHSTGSRGVPYYGIWIVCSPVSSNFIPTLDFSGATVMGKIEKLSDSIFEVY